MFQRAQPPLGGAMFLTSLPPPQESASRGIFFALPAMNSPLPAEI